MPEMVKGVQPRIMIPIFRHHPTQPMFFYRFLPNQRGKKQGKNPHSHIFFATSDVIRLGSLFCFRFAGSDETRMEFSLFLGWRTVDWRLTISKIKKNNRDGNWGLEKCTILAEQACCWAIQYKYKHFIRKIKIDEDFFCFLRATAASPYCKLKVGRSIWFITIFLRRPESRQRAFTVLFTIAFMMIFHFFPISQFTRFPITLTTFEGWKDIWWCCDIMIIDSYPVAAKLSPLLTNLFAFLRLPLNFSSWGGSMISMLSCFDIFAINNLDTN